jgi:hypothetical protein
MGSEFTFRELQMGTAVAMAGPVADVQFPTWKAEPGCEAGEDGVVKGLKGPLVNVVEVGEHPWA